MITFDQFFAQWNGKYCEVSDPSNLNQCFDLAFAYCDSLGITRSAISHLYAYQIYTLPTDDTVNNFYLIPNTPNGTPKKGDIVVWGQSYNGFAGHVGIANGRSDTNSFDAFEQNDPLKTPSHIKTYNYTAVLGWLRPQILIQSNCQPYQDQINNLQAKINRAKSDLA